MTVGAPPLPPQPSIGRVNPNGTPTQAQIDYERQFSKWVNDYISSVVGGALPFPTPTTLGGVKSATAPTHQFQKGIDGTGSPIFGQPAAADITGLGPFATGTTVPAASVTGLATIATTGLASDLIGSAAVPAPTPTTLGGLFSSSAPAFSFATGLDTSGNLQYRQPSFSDVGGQVLAAQLPTPAAATLGGVNSLAAVSHKFLTSIGTDGVPVAAQPDFSDLSGSLAALTIGTHLTGTSYNGSAGVTIATDATNANTASTIVARDGSGNFSAGTITAALTGHASADLQASNNLSDLASAKTARSSTGLNVESGTGRGNSDYTILSTDRWVYTNAAFTAPRTFTLPAASSKNAGEPLIIDDVQNTLTATNTLTISRAGSDLINAVTSLAMNVAGMRCVLISDGVSKWSATLTVTGITGTGSAVLSASPTFTGTAIFAGASFNTAGITTATIGTSNVTTLNATTVNAGTINASSTAIATGTITITADGGGNANMEIGSTSVVTTPYIDFHSSGHNIDYDARISAAGGTGSAGNGVLNFYGASFAFNGAMSITTPLPSSSGGTGDTGTAWTAYTPTVSAASGSFTTVSATGRYKTIGKTVFFSMVITITTNGTATGDVIASLPVASQGTATAYGRENGVSGKMLQGVSSGSSLFILNYDNTYPGANSASLVLGGVYEST